MRAFLSALLLTFAAALPAAAQQAYPNKPVRVIVPFPAGGATDLIARALGQRLQERWGQPFVTENRPGAATIIGIDLVAKAPADGYTLLLGSNTLALNRLLYKTLPYDVDADIQPVVLMTKIPNLLVVHPGVPAQNVTDLIALAKAKPGTLNYASTGTGAAPHLFTELFLHMAGVNIVHVPYQGTPQAEIDLINGQVHLMFMNMTGALPPVKAGKLRSLGVTTTERSRVEPDMPTLSETGLKGYEAVGWFGIAVRKGTPAEIVTKLNTEINAILQTDSFRTTLQQFAGEVVGGTPEAFDAFIKDEIRKWGEVVRAANIQPN